MTWQNVLVSGSFGPTFGKHGPNAWYFLETVEDTIVLYFDTSHIFIHKFQQCYLPCFTIHTIPRHWSGRSQNASVFLCQKWDGTRMC